MLSISPTKLLIVLVVGLIVLGPDKLPRVARQLGAFWGELRKVRDRLEREVRETFPGLPPAHQVAQVVRSPIALLDRLAEVHERERLESESEGQSASDLDQPRADASTDALERMPSEPAAASGAVSTDGASTAGAGTAGAVASPNGPGGPVRGEARGFRGADADGLGALADPSWN
jgi:sec-independent protein translocase protein TatB